MKMLSAHRGLSRQGISQGVRLSIKWNIEILESTFCIHNHAASPALVSVWGPACYCFQTCIADFWLCKESTTKYWSSVLIYSSKINRFTGTSLPFILSSLTNKLQFIPPGVQFWGGCAGLCFLVCHMRWELQNWQQRPFICHSSRSEWCATFSPHCGFRGGFHVYSPCSRGNLQLILQEKSVSGNIVACSLATFL